MRNAIAITLVLFLVLLTGCTEETLDVNGKGTITGTVVEDETFLPLQNVKISTNPNSSTVFTDELGQFSLEVVSGTYAVKAEKDEFLVSFESAEVLVDDETNVVFELKVSTANNKPPPAPVLVFPTDNAVDVDFDTRFEWEAMDPDGDSLTYSLQLRNGRTDAVIDFTGIEERSFETTLQFGTTYFWQVTASDGINEPVNSEVNSFTTTAFPTNRFHIVRKSGSNNIIYSGNGENEETPLTPPSENSWRPRLNRTISKIAYLKSVGAAVHVFTMDPDGSNSKQITNTVPVNGFNLYELDISWNNNGSSIYYPSQDKLYRINRDGSGLTMVYQTSNGNLITEVDYNDGTIALKTNDLNGYNVSIFTIDENGQLKDLVLSNVMGAAGGLELSIDNKRLVYSKDVSNFENDSYRRLDSRVFVYSFTDGNSTALSLNKPDGSNDLDPRFSPTDAQVIVTNVANDGVGPSSIQILDTNQTDSREELFTDYIMPDWD